MDFKKIIIKNLSDFFESIGITPLYGITLIFLLIISPTFKKLKNRDSVPKYLKEFYILGWISAFIALIVCIINLLQ